MKIKVSSSFYNEPTETCPKCGGVCHSEWVDVGFGPYSAQVGPYICGSCGHVCGGCAQESCIKEKCISFDKCKGESLGGLTNGLNK
jgi:hypothetical protein